MTDTEQTELPWRVADLPGSRTDSGPTYNGGYFHGGGEKSGMNLSVRVWAPMGRPATVELGIGSHDHGCAATLKPALAREAARALMAAADKADAEMAEWRGVGERLRAEMAALALREATARAGIANDAA